MIVAALALFGLFTGAAGLACSGGLSYSESGVCAAGQGTPDCTFIQVHAAAICDVVLPNFEIVNGMGDCSLRGAGSGCFLGPRYDTDNTFCCNLAPSPSATASVSATVSSSASATASTTGYATVSASGSATASRTAHTTISTTRTSSPTSTSTMTSTGTLTRTPYPVYIFDSQTDFSAIQGNNGWIYGYYDGAGVYSMGLTYMAGDAPAAVAPSWMFNPECAGWISATTMMPNDQVSCCCTQCGVVMPSLIWVNANSLPFYMQIMMTLFHYENGGQGDWVYLIINNQTVYSQIITYASGTVTMTYLSYVNTVELKVQPWQGCDFSHVNYRLTIVPIPSTPSITSTAAPSASASSSASVTMTTFSTMSANPSLTATYSSIATVSGSPSWTATESANPTASSSPSWTATESAIATVSGSPSGTSSLSAVATPSSTATWSTSTTGTGSPSSSSTAFMTPTPLSSSSSIATVSTSPSPSASASASDTPTPSQTPTPSITPSPSFALPPPVEGQAPVLPQNLSELTAAQVDVVFNSLADYKPAQIQDSLQKLGSAALGSGGEFEVETNSFKLAMKAIDPMAAQNVSVVGLQIAMPPLNTLVPGAAAAAVIQWTTNPYENLTTEAPPDSKIVSFTLLDSAGNEISAKNLSSPISMNWDLAIPAGDPRIQPAPTYVLDCAKDVLYVDGGSMYSVFHGGNKSARATWSVPCLLDQWMPLNCSSRLGFESTTCPTPTYLHDCLYWDKSLSGWSSDGCTAINGTFTGMVCKCTHLTDFSARLRAVAADNKAVFANAAHVYSLAGLRDYAQWYGVFGGLALATLLLSAYVVRVDAQAATLYVDSLLKNNVVRQLLSHQPKDPIYVYNEKSTLDDSHAHVEPPVHVERNLNLFQRILQQHSRLEFLFRFDPRLSRLFRLLFLFVVQFHSLFITALLYGFMHGDTPIQWYDTVVLALITMALNLPVVKILIYMMNRIGNHEFKFLYPLLYVEHKRRAEFELYAMAYFTKRGLAEFADQDTKLFEKKELLEKREGELLREMGAIIREQYPYVERYSRWVRFLPAHTWLGWFYLASCFGWFGWCINYLLLFAAAHDKSVGEHVLTSYATSEITTVFLIQPLTILGTIFVYWLLNRCGARIPAWIHRAMLIRNIGSTPSLYYFSDPWNEKSHTSFTAEYSYNLFVHAAAQASGVPDIAYAPMQAIAAQIGSDTELGEDGRAALIVSLYTRLWDGWQRLGLRR